MISKDNVKWLRSHLRELALVLNQVLLFIVRIGIQNIRELTLQLCQH